MVRLIFNRMFNKEKPPLAGGFFLYALCLSLGGAGGGDGRPAWEGGGFRPPFHWSPEGALGGGFGCFLDIFSLLWGLDEFNPFDIRYFEHNTFNLR